MKKEKNRHAGASGRKHRPRQVQRQNGQFLDCGLDRPLPGNLTSGAKWGGSRSRPGTGQRSRGRRRVPKNTGTEHVIVQFQDKKDVQLHQDCKPGRQKAHRSVPAKHGSVPGILVAQNAKPAERRHPSLPGCKESGSRKSPAAAVKSALPQSQWRRAVGYRTQFRARVPPEAVRGRPPAPSS